MKFNVTPLMAAAAIATSLSGQAMAATITAAVGDTAYLNGAPLVLNGSSQASLVYNSGQYFDGQNPDSMGGAVRMFNVVKLEVRGVDGVAVEETVQLDLWDEMVRTRTNASLDVQRHAIDDATGKILSMSTTGGIAHSGARFRAGGTLTGGVATVSNLRFDLVNHLVYADLTGTKEAVGTNPSVSYNLPNTAMWTIDSVTGPSAIDPAALGLTGQARIDALVAGGFTYDGHDGFSAQTVLSNLRITAAGLDFFRHSLGLRSPAVEAFSAVNEDDYGWGSITLNLSFNAPAVPEPGSYALAGVGVLMVLSARRARRSNGTP